jgi:hypothetical protein
MDMEVMEMGNDLNEPVQLRMRYDPRAINARWEEPGATTDFRNGDERLPR